MCPTKQQRSNTPTPHIRLQVWPLLVDYFYRDSITVSEGNALALLSLSRQLLISSVDAYCLEFIGQHLDTYNCIRYLRKAVKHNISDIQQQCVALTAQGAGGITWFACDATCGSSRQAAAVLPRPCICAALRPHCALSTPCAINHPTMQCIHLHGSHNAGGVHL
jgi:hypothetical protein